MPGHSFGRGKNFLRSALVAFLVLGTILCQSALAREVTRLADLPNDFQSWSALRVDDARLAETAKGLPTGHFFHGADFCLGAGFDAGMAQGIVGGLPLHSIAYCPAGLSAFRGTGQAMTGIKNVGADRPLSGPSIVTQTMCGQVFRHR